MSFPLSSSFASAAAGNAQDPSSSRRAGDNSTGEWSRSRQNGATQTFRRPSGAASHSRESLHTTSSAAAPIHGTYVPPHQSSSYAAGSIGGTSGRADSRYSREQLLELYRDVQHLPHVSELFMAHWNPHEDSYSAEELSSRRNESKDHQANPEVCWDHTGRAQPLALTDLTDEEKNLFSSSVNSPLKPPPQAGSKDSAAVGGPAARKGSVPHAQSHFNSSSPTSARARRRGTGDSTGNTMSPPSSNQRFPREETNTATPPSSLLRRKTDIRDTAADQRFEERTRDRDATSDHSPPFGALRRSATNPASSATSNSASSWASSQPSQGTGFSSMGGAFGNFSLGPITPGASAAEKKPSVGSVRGESRFKNLLSKSSSEDVNSVGKEKQSTTGLGRLSETEDDSSHPVPDQVAQGRAARSGTNPFFEPRSGSAALGGEEAPSSTGIEQFAPSSIGFPSSTGASNFQDLMPTSQQPALQPPPNRETASPTNTNPYQSPQRGQQLNQGDLGAETSDFRQAHLPDLSELHDDAGNATFLAYLQRGSAAEDPLGDRSQTSSAGANRGFSGLGPLMHSLSSSGGGWPPVASTAPGDTANCGSAFPATFGDPIFGSMADLQSPNLSTLGAGSFFGSHTGGAAPGFAGAGNRPSKLHSLFPPAMQDQMRDDQSRQELPSNEGVAQPQGPTLPEGAAMSNQQGAPPMVQVPSGAAPGQGVTTSIGQSHFEQPSQIPQNAAPQPNAANSQLPPAQQRQMVMPDRMRWIYRDPQGATQGPFSGLEMHDWFKAGFFTADLQVKKVEDTEYEPLATLIRRIGNSREPFLVPQIGVPHGVPSQPNNGWSGSGGSGGGGSAPAAAAAPAAPAATSGGGGGPNGGVQPPFPSSFPNFGTTLTAEQQNALERRKQEEQYLMARQKEHLQQHQTMMKQMSMPSMPSIPPPPMHPQQLQHHGSGHSLNSQPSYGSITSPTGGMPPPMQAPIQPPQQPQAMPGYYEQPPLMRQNTMPNLTPQMHPPDVARGSQEDLPTMMDRMNVNPSAPQPPFAGGAEQPENTLHSQQVAAMLQDRARLQQEQEQFDMNNQTDSIFDQHAREERLRQFHALRGSSDEELAARRADGLPTHPAGPPDDARQLQQQQYQYQQGGEILESGYEIQRDQEPTLSLAQQVQKTASDQLQQQQQQAQSAAGQTESPWKVETGMPQPFPPPPRTLESPLPAPSPQRSRQNVADALAAEMRSESQASAEAPPTSIAPWAKEHNEAPKGPSLKEIQEAEARQAAKMEEAASAARRAHAEQEHAAAAAADQGTSPAPGLPSTANWASGGSAPAAPATGTGSAWTKPLAGRAQPSSNQGVPKKTLAQIQKEEEARKQRQTGAAATATNNTHGAMPSPAAAPAVKRYADLAGKATPPSTAAATATAPTAASSVGDAWTTVGAGGKPKAPPPAPAPAPAPTVQRSVTAAASSVATAAGKPYPPAAPTRSATLGSGATAPNPGKAMEELTKWAKMMLGRGLNNSINVGDFVQQLQILPAEVEIISDSVYANSQTLDGRRFAEEYVRRRNLAERGIMDTSAPSAGSFGPSTEQASSSSGWNEVAKKGPSNANHDDDSDSAAFKVVAGKKKGKR